jgi:hypothetical protein
MSGLGRLTHRRPLRRRGWHVTVMVPDPLEPTDDVGACCLAVVADLHAVRHLLLAQTGALIGGG